MLEQSQSTAINDLLQLLSRQAVTRPATELTGGPSFSDLLDSALKAPDRTQTPDYAVQPVSYEPTRSNFAESAYQTPYQNPVTDSARAEPVNNPNQTTAQPVINALEARNAQSLQSIEGNSGNTVVENAMQDAQNLLRKLSAHQQSNHQTKVDSSPIAHAAQGIQGRVAQGQTGQTAKTPNKTDDKATLASLTHDLSTQARSLQSGDEQKNERKIPVRTRKTEHDSEQGKVASPQENLLFVKPAPSTKTAKTQTEPKHEAAVAHETAKAVDPKTEAAKKMAEIANVDVSKTDIKTAQDAVRLIRDLAKQLGIKDSDGSSKKDDSFAVNAKADKKGDARLELLRNARLSPKNENLRVDVVQSSSRSVPASAQAQALHSAGVLPSALKAEDTRASRDTASYNPLSPQAVMHHTVTLPAGTPVTTANLTQTLRTQLKETLNSDMVGQAKILLSGNDKGEIRLVLHPENLGEVSIHMKLEDSAIGGTIFVDDKNVLQVFKDNMADLQQAFRDGGLDANGLTLALRDDASASNGGNQGNTGNQNRQDDRNFVRYAQDTLGSSVPSVGAWDRATSMVDVTA